MPRPKHNNRITALFIKILNCSSVPTRVWAQLVEQCHHDDCGGEVVQHSRQEEADGSYGQQQLRACLGPDELRDDLRWVAAGDREGGGGSNPRQGHL